MGETLSTTVAAGGEPRGADQVLDVVVIGGGPAGLSVAAHQDQDSPRMTFRSKRIEGAHDKEGDTFRVIGDLTI